jgi:hypothetical protein
MLVYAAEPFETWLHFIWWSAAPLTASVFAIEYLVRCIVIPAHERTAAIDMFRAIATMYGPRARSSRPTHDAAQADREDGRSGTRHRTTVTASQHPGSQEKAHTAIAAAQPRRPGTGARRGARVDARIDSRIGSS